MNGNKKHLLLAAIVLLLLYGCNEDMDQSDANEGRGTELVISAAASLTDALGEVAEEYEKIHPDTKLTFNFAGSGTLAHQIEQGAPVDLFIAANRDWMDLLIDKGLIDEKDKIEVTGNRLVMIASADSHVSYASFSDLDARGSGQIAIGNPGSVPAGEYTAAILNNLNKWEALEGTFVYAKDVRQVLTYVETGNTELGFVYESDALSSDKVKIIAKADPNNHDPIVYPGAVLKESPDKEEGNNFLSFLQSQEGQIILDKYGFKNVE